MTDDQGLSLLDAASRQALARLVHEREASKARIAAAQPEEPMNTPIVIELQGGHWCSPGSERP